MIQARRTSGWGDVLALMIFRSELRCSSVTGKVLMGRDMHGILAEKVVLSSYFSGSTLAQLTTRTWNQGAASGQWNIGSNWTPSGIPNGPADRAVIDGGLAANADVVLSSDQSIASLAVSTGDTLRFNPGITLTLSRPSAGHVAVDLGGTLAIGTGTLRLNNAATLNGFGSATLTGGTIQAANPPTSGGGPYDVLNNRVILRGHGTVLPAVNNLETVQADVVGQTLTLPTITDNVSGVIESINGGRLALGDPAVSVIDDLHTIANGSGGLVRASGAGSIVDFHGGITGGSIRNDGGTFRSIGGQVKWTNLQVASGKISFQPNPALPAATGRNVLTFSGLMKLNTGENLTGTIDNRGEVVFEGSHSTGQSLIGCNGPIILQGGGSLKMEQGGPGTGGPVSFERLNYDGEKFTNGKPVAPSATLTAIDRHTVQGGAKFQVEVVNQPGGVFFQPVTAAEPLHFLNKVTNLGDITSNKTLKFEAAYGIEPSGDQFLLNRPGGTIQANTGTLDFGRVTLVNEGRVVIRGGTVANKGPTGGAIVNTGVFEVAGNSTLNLNTFSTNARTLLNSGDFRVLDSSTVNFTGGFELTELSNLVLGIVVADPQLPRINVIAGGPIGKLAGNVSAQIASGFNPPVGTTFPLLAGGGLYQGRFSNARPADLEGNATLILIYEPHPDREVPYWTGVSAEVVAAQKVTASTSQTVTARRDLYLAMKAEAGASLTAVFIDALFSSPGAEFLADPTGLILLSLAAGVDVMSEGDFTAAAGPVEIDIPPTSSFRVHSLTFETTAKFRQKGVADAPVISRGAHEWITGSATKDYMLDKGGMLSSKISQQFNDVQSIVAVGGGNFETLRDQVQAAALSVAPWREGALDAERIVQVTRIIAMGGGNIVAVGGGNFSLVPGAAFTVSGIYFDLEQLASGANPNALTTIANTVASGNSRFTDPAKLLPVIAGLVTPLAEGGADFGAVSTERILQIIANGGGNFDTNLDIFQAANIVAVGGGNIVANGGGNFTGVGELLPQISSSINSFKVANIIANGGGNIIANGGGHYDYSGVSPSPALRSRGPRNGPQTNLLTVNGDFVQSKQALTRLQVAGIEKHDQVVVTGTATLDGSLGVLFADPDDLLNPATTFSPPSGIWFDVMVAPRFNVVAGFELRLPKLAVGQTWSHAFVSRGDGTGALRLFVNGPNGPEIAVEGSGGVPILDGGSKSFGNIPEGSTGTLTFTVRNTGDAALTGLAASLTGTGLDAIEITTQPASTLAGPSGSTTFTVTYSPFFSGTSSATLRIASNDADENPFRILLRGDSGENNALALFNAWAAGNGLFGEDALPGAKPQGDGVPNLLKYAFGLNPAAPDVRVLGPNPEDGPGLPLVSVTGEGGGRILRVEFLRRINSGLDYLPQKSLSLLNDSWSPVEDSDPEVLFFNAIFERVIFEEIVGDIGPRLFGNLQVTVP